MSFTAHKYDWRGKLRTFSAHSRHAEKCYPGRGLSFDADAMYLRPRDGEALRFPRRIEGDVSIIHDYAENEE